MKKPKITIHTNEKMPQESVEELLRYKKDKTLNEYFENRYVLKNENKKIKAGNIILFNFSNVLLYCKVNSSMITKNIFTNKEKQVIDFTYEDIIIK